MGILKRLKQLKGSGLKYRLLHPHDEYWERRLNVGTIGFEMPDDPDGRSNYASPYATIAAAIRRMDLGSGDVFVDLGCGYGRPTLFAATQYPLTLAVGIDLNPAVIDKAQANAARVRNPRCQIRFHALPAQDYDFTPVTAVFMYNPFGADTMRQVVDRLKATMTPGKPLRIAYVNPQHREVLDEADWLERYDEIRPSVIRGLYARPGAASAVLYRAVSS